MALVWEKRRILIWGKTRPEFSQKYREIVCTGGVFEDTKKLVRIYPVPLRFMNDSSVFRKYQWIEAHVARNDTDPRPESYRINPDTITTHEIIPTKRGGNWDERAKWIMDPQNLFHSVEALQSQQRTDKTSLGLIRPKEIKSIKAHAFNQQERDQFWDRYQEAVKQMELPLDPDTGRKIRPLTPADYRFKISFACDDPSCSSVHNFSILDWETDALYFNLRQRGDAKHVAERKVIQKLEQICGSDKDTHFYLGNIYSHQQIFTIVGFWWPSKG